MFYTHKHWDHVGNPTELEKMLKSRNDYLVKFHASSIDSKEIDFDNLDVLEGSYGEHIINGIEMKYHLVPCHTKGHLLYHFKNHSEEKAPDWIYDEKIKFFESNDFLFTGDTLFIGGCGRFFEGKPSDMLKNFDLISQLGDNTHIFCGHEYTK